MKQEQFRLGRIETIQNVTLSLFNERFGKQSPLFVFGGNHEQVKNQFTPLEFDPTNPMAQLARELQMFDIPSCGLPLDQKLKPAIKLPPATNKIMFPTRIPGYIEPLSERSTLKARPELALPASKAHALSALARIFYAVGFGNSVVIPVRPVHQFDINGIAKFDLHRTLRRTLVEQAILPNEEVTFDLWDGPSTPEYIAGVDMADLKERREFAKFYARWADSDNFQDWDRYLAGTPWMRKMYIERPLLKRMQLHCYYSEALIKLKQIINMLSQCDNPEAAKAKLLELKQQPQSKTDLVSQAEYQTLIEHLIDGMADKKAVQNNQFDQLKDPTVTAFREGGSLSVRLSQASGLTADNNKMSDKAWLKAIACVETVAAKMNPMEPSSEIRPVQKMGNCEMGFGEPKEKLLYKPTQLSVIRPLREKGIIEIGFDEPKEWLLYKPAQNAMTVARHCTKRSFRVVIEMAMVKKMKWIDVGDLLPDQVAMIKEQVSLLGAQIEVRDAHNHVVANHKLLSARPVVPMQVDHNPMPVQDMATPGLSG